MRIKQIVKKTLAITLAMALLCSMSTMLFSMVASADTVEVVVSDDFTAGGKATVGGVATERTDAWALYDYEGVLKGTATVPTDITSDVNFSASVADIATSSEISGNYVTATTTGLLSLPVKTDALFTYKGWNNETDKIKEFKADYIKFRKASRGGSDSFCVYYNPATGMAIDVTIRNANYVTGTGNTEVNLNVLNITEAGVVSQGLSGDNGFLIKSGVTSNPELTMDMTATYDYDANGDLIKITMQFTLYQDSTKTVQLAKSLNRYIHFTHTDGETNIKTQRDTTYVDLSANTRITYNQDFLVGFRAPSNSTFKNAFSNISMKFDREVFVDHNALAAQFKTDNEAILALETTGVNATNAVSVVAVKEAYDALFDGTKEILVADGTAAKLTALFGAAVAFIPTANQTAFEEYYAANIEGKLTAVGSEDKFEEALRLYDLVEETHKVNVEAKYANICDVTKDSFVVDNGDGTQTVSYPARTNEKLYALTKSFTDTQSYASAMSYKINAYNLYHNYTGKNQGTINIYPVYFEDGIQHGIKADHQAGAYGEETIQGVKFGRIRNALFGDAEAIFATKPAYSRGDSTAYFFNEAFLDRNPAAVELTNKLFVDNPDTTEGGADPVITAQNPYFTLTITAGLGTQGIKFNETYNCYVINYFYTTTAFVDGDGDGVYTAGTADILIKTMPVNIYYKSDKDYIEPISYYSSTVDNANLVDEVVTLTHVTPITDGQRFVKKYDSIFASEKPGVDDALNMYFDYADENAELQTEIKKEVYAVLDKAGVLPAADGATIRTGLDQNMAFYVNKPSKVKTETYRVKEMGAVIAGADYLAENDKELVMGEEGVVFGGLKYEEGEQVAASMLAVLKGTNISASDKWGIRIAARAYVVWTNGTNDYVVYSVNDDANNTDIYDNEFDTSGTCIRTVNGIIKAIANKIYTGGDLDLCAENPGVETEFSAGYKGVNYASVKPNLDVDGVILTGGTRDPEATLKMILAFQKLLFAILES